METTSTPYRLDYDDKYFKFTAFKSWFEKDRTLLIERQTCRLKESQGLAPNLIRSKRLNIHLIIGIIVVEQEPFLAVVTNTQQATLIIREPVYQIKDVAFIAFRKGFNDKKFNYLQIVKDLDAIRDNILSDNFYFCYNYDLTLSLQKKNESTPTQRMFFWNQEMLTEFRMYGVSKAWMVPIIQGFVKGFRNQTLYVPYQYTLISRRSKYQSGTRFTSRGANADGHVANFVQTEEIYCFHRIAISWVIIRGSVPLFWGQSGFGAHVKIVDSNNQKNIMDKHFKMLEKQYNGKIIVVDLLSDVPGTTVAEHELQRKFSKMYFEHFPEEAYINFDLNTYVSKNKNDVQTALQKWVNKNTEYLCGNFFVFEYYEGNILQRQTVFSRVNCLDCLDRTNVVQFKSSQRMMSLLQKYANQYAQVEQKKVTFNEDFKDRHRQLWTQNGDRISLIYSGTTSVASYITKGEKSKNFFSSLGSGIKSINRYYNANVNDNYKQQCIEWVLRSAEDSKHYYFQDQASLQLKQSQYCEFQQVNLTIISWNCAQVSPTDIDLGSLLEMPSLPDVLVICLQQVVELNTYNVLLGGTKNNENRWKQSLEKIMKIHDKKFVLIGEKDLVGVLTLVFVSQRHLDSITNVNWSEIKTGFKGNLGNKGAVAVSFKFQDSVITIFNCHLEAGEGKLSERLYSVECIHNNCFAEKSQHRQYQNSDFEFFVGDLNFRIEMDAAQAKQMIYKIQKQRKTDPSVYLPKLLEPLLSTDELNLSIEKHQILQQFSQVAITFLPTYKFVKKTNQYDPKRTPSWCDRILYKSTNPNKLMVEKYGCKESMHYSDHKPVYGIFNIFARKENKQKKKKLYEQFMKW